MSRTLSTYLRWFLSQPEGIDFYGDEGFAVFLAPKSAVAIPFGPR